MDLSPTQVPVAVIGGGITGLAAAARLVGHLGGEGVVLLERDRRAGGKLVTHSANGFLLEGGPDSFLAAKRGGMELVRELGLDADVITADERQRRAYVRRAGRLHELPAGITGLVPGRVAPLLRTRLLSPSGRVRAALEWFVPRRVSDDDESLAAFARRRFGDEAWDWLVEPLLSGIYAGDGTRLSVNATFPQLAELERDHGGVLRAMMARRSLGEAGSTPGFVTLAGGLGQLATAIETRLGRGVVRTESEARAVRRRRDGYLVECTEGRAFLSDAVIVATPASVGASLLQPLDPALSDLLGETRFVSVATVSVAFADRDIPQHLHGTGWISPRAEGGPIVACTWASNKFRGRAPANHTLLRFFLGRAGDDGVASADDRTIQQLVHETLARVHTIHAEPLFWHIQRWPNGMPQYDLGHATRLAAVNRRLDAFPGLAIAGSSWHGVGVPDCITSGWRAADRALTSLTVRR